MVSVYADGSSTGRATGPGGFGWAIVVVDENRVVAQGSGHSCDSTNNRMEMMAAIVGLRTFFFQYQELLKTHGVELVSDSQYVLGLATGSYKPTKNLDLAKVLRDIFIEHPQVSARWVRGHDGEKWNELVDGLAKKGKQKAADINAADRHFK